ncbi:hypothetical protein JOC25_001715 [Solibacillus kalamii]|uniref:O-antigen polysaccharide polymerase Wzy n=1 Tax=Solibacillus kalamii TaxID=1748298 RepID=A0ABX3ZKV9_9BACL|nr:hypothetical protein [Solibacillus kalamii]MBM7665256.1 hypothetical protein [Solibacillus kalamii]OUZ40385.1 hypothetical protein CBM15_00580 [Solibacillus kalamii]
MKSLILNLFIILTSLLSILYCLLSIGNIPLGYELIWIQPLVYLLSYFLIYLKILRTKKYKITVYSILILSWLRLVMIPFISSISGQFEGASYINVSQESLNLANFLIIYEFIVVSFFLAFIIHLKNNYYYGDFNLKSNLELKGNKIVYAVFIFVSFLLYITIGRQLNLLEFFVISINTSERFSDITSTPLVLLRQIFKVSMIFIFVWCTSYFYKRYIETNSRKYVLFAIILAILNVGVIIGERRSEQLYTLLVIVFILIKIFKKHRKKIIVSVSIATGIVLLFMSIYKHFAAFYYGSYTAALSTSNSDIKWLSETLHLYFFGIQNVAATIELKSAVDLSVFNMLYDYGRSFFGISFFLKDKMIMTTEYFNTFIYGFNKAGGHVMSGIGYGYFYLGVLFSPIIVCLNVFIAIKLEKWFNNTDSYELKYIVGYMLVRFATNIFVNTPPLISLSTIMLFTAGLLFLVANYFKSKQYYKVRVPKQS